MTRPYREGGGVTQRMQVGLARQGWLKRVIPLETLWYARPHQRVNDHHMRMCPCAICHRQGDQTKMTQFTCTCEELSTAFIHRR